MGKAFLTLQEIKTPKKFIIFSQKKAFLMLQETKLSYISGNSNPKKLLIFQEVTFQAQKMKRTHS